MLNLMLSHEELEQKFKDSDYHQDGDYLEFLGRVAGNVANYLFTQSGTEEGAEAYLLWTAACFKAIRGGL